MLIRVSNLPALINALREDIHNNNDGCYGDGILVKRLGKVGSTDDNDAFQLFETVTGI